MKKNILVLFFFLAHFLSAQGIKVNYEFMYIKDTIDEKTITTEEMLLQINSVGDSYYISHNKYKADSMRFLRKNDKLVIPKSGPIIIADLNKDIPVFQLQYSVEKKNGNYCVRTKIPMKNYSINDEMEQINWQIFDESKQWFGYTLKKATTTMYGKNWIAWFTEEIPYAEGPYKFKGLPGLILEIEDDKKRFLFKANEIKNTSANYVVYEDYRDFIKIAKKDYQKLVKNYEENPLSAMQDSRFSVPNEEEFLKRKQAGILANNNPIENAFKLNLK